MVSNNHLLFLPFSPHPLSLLSCFLISQTTPRFNSVWKFIFLAMELVWSETPTVQGLYSSRKGGARLRAQIKKQGKKGDFYLVLYCHLAPKHPSSIVAVLFGAAILHAGKRSFAFASFMTMTWSLHHLLQQSIKLLTFS